MLPNLEIEQEIECPTMYSFHHSYFSGSTRMRKGGEYENEQRRQAEKLIKEPRFGCTTNIAMVINYYA